jgi:RNA polymerase sigma-70 factor (ECF subfamily)
VTEARPSPAVNVRDRESVEAIYRTDGPSIRSFLRHCLADPRAADDVLQETFLELWRKPQSYDPARGSVRQFLFGVARRRAAQWYRDNAVIHATAASVVPLVPDAGESTAIKHALMQLDDASRALLWLREVEGYSYDELASILDVPLGTVKSRLFTARVDLRRVWLGERDRTPRSGVR